MHFTFLSFSCKVMMALLSSLYCFEIRNIVGKRIISVVFLPAVFSHHFNKRQLRTASSIDYECRTFFNPKQSLYLWSDGVCGFADILYSTIVAVLSICLSGVRQRKYSYHVIWKTYSSSPSLATSWPCKQSQFSFLLVESFQC